MKIIPNQTFKHETKTYRKGHEYEVSEEDAEYFGEVGWIGERSSKAATHSLEIHDGQLGQTSEVN